MIETLPPLSPDPQRSERTLARCHDRLSRRHKSRITRSHPGATYLAIERVIVGGVCVIYISSVALVAMQMLTGR